MRIRTQDPLTTMSKVCAMKMQQPIPLHEPITWKRQIRTGADVVALLLAVDIQENRKPEEKDADLRRRITCMRTREESSS